MRRDRNWLRPAARLCALGGDQRGAVAIYVGIMSFVMVGVGALAVDLGRLYTLETELQKVADARCIAGAKELDGTPDAITRATAAAQRLSSGTAGAIVENTQTFASQGTVLTGAEAQLVETVNVRFFGALPPDDMRLDDPQVQNKYVTTDPAFALFDEVTVERKILNNTLIRILGGPDTTTMNAVSVCGVDETICDVPGMMICNPAEPGSPNAEPSFFDQMGRLLIAKQHTESGSFWKPGEFGLLDTPWGCVGTSCVREYLAQVQQERPICFNARVDIRPGQAMDVRRGLNVRFGVYHGSMKKFKNDGNYRPGKDVVKGAKRTDPQPIYDADGNLTGYTSPTACDMVDDTSGTSKRFPRDNIITKGRFGNGVWDFCDYWEINHGPCASSPWGAGGMPTRAEVYQWEIENAQVPDADDGFPTTEELGKTDVVNPDQACYQGPDLCMSPYEPGCADALLDRRELVIAVINCEALGLNGNEDNVPVAEWYRMFLTEPVGGSNPGASSDPLFKDFDVILETMGPLSDEDRLLHREIIVYRGYSDVE